MSEQIEASLDAIKAKLDAQLNAKIDAVNTGVADGLTIAYPTAIVVGASHEFTPPYVVVVPDESTSPTDAAAFIEWLHTIRVVSFVAEWDTNTLVRKLIRMQRAVREVVLTNRRPGVNIGDGGWSTSFLRDEYGPVFQPEPDQEFIQGVATIFQVRQGQDIP